MRSPARRNGRCDGRSRSLAPLALLIAASVASTANAAEPNKSHHDRVLAYWTAERIKSAKPLDKHLTKPSSRPGAPDPASKPVRPAPPPPTSVPSTTGKQWPNGVGTIYKATGRVLFTMNGGNWICSGSVVNDALSTASIVLSAGHCAFDQANHAFVTNWIFIPEFDSHPSLWNCTTTAYGCWVADSLNVSAGFANQSGFNTTAAQYDWSFAVVHGGGFTGAAQLDATVGSFPIAFKGYSSGTQTVAFGYPAGGKYSPGNELDLLLWLTRNRRLQPGPYLSAGLRYDRRFVRWPMADRLRNQRKQRHPELAQLLHVQRHHGDARTEVQQRHASGVQRCDDRDR